MLNQHSFQTSAPLDHIYVSHPVICFWRKRSHKWIINKTKCVCASNRPLPLSYFFPSNHGWKEKGCWINICVHLKIFKVNACCASDVIMAFNLLVSVWLWTLPYKFLSEGDGWWAGLGGLRGALGRWRCQNMWRSLCAVFAPTLSFFFFLSFSLNWMYKVNFYRFIYKKKKHNYIIKGARLHSWSKKTKLWRANAKAIHIHHTISKPFPT